ncbi:hypothetical protein CQ393_10725 [Stenotrophomonas sp. MYb238]|uniref:hypothetical protein n=1 Tax=Stenotrophomonas sp. MYb238 TaxID=2040281 RepID=UPI001290CB6B|nr:hypothetical protein [Stenotrophomonas sp. MYb238]MQP76361.1 hypothetical protein [Stenotrophomonas sp. MYb238]
MLDAFSKPAERLRKENPKGRWEHTFQRNASLISAPWDYEGGVVDETREITFLRDFFNLFHECMHSCQTMDVISILTRQTLSQTPDEHLTAVITYWSESYLNEVYILKLRLGDFVTYAERKYKKDKDFAEPIVGVCKDLREFAEKQLAPFITTRGEHVHSRRYRNSDPELARLSALDLSINALGQSELKPLREEAVQAATAWLFKQTDLAAEICWGLFDGTCMVLAEGIVTENDWIIVPIPFKDNPEPFLKDCAADT